MDVLVERGVTFRQERIADAWDEAVPLLFENAAESGFLPASEFKPDRAKIEQFEGLGLLRAYVARVDARLVGYVVFLIAPHLHYPATSWAKQDVLFVHRNHRGRLAVRFIDWQDAELRRSGVDLVYRHVTVHAGYAKLLERRGYVHQESAYIRDLRRAA